MMNAQKLIGPTLCVLTAAVIGKGINTIEGKVDVKDANVIDGETHEIQAVVGEEAACGRTAIKCRSEGVAAGPLWLSRWLTGRSRWRSQLIGNV